MFKGILAGLGVLVLGAVIYQAKKEQEFNNSINDITRRTTEEVLRNMDRLNQEAIHRMNQQMNNMM